MRPAARMLSQARGVRCAAVQQIRLGPLGPVAALAAGHAGRCLVCQAEEARERALTRLLATLRDSDEPAPTRFVERVVARLDSPDPVMMPARRRTGGRNRLVVAVSASALTVGVALAAARHLRPALV